MRMLLPACPPGAALEHRGTQPFRSAVYRRRQSRWTGADDRES